MLMRLAGAPQSASVYDLGLDNHTVADGLAVARASEFAFDHVRTSTAAGPDKIAIATATTTPLVDLVDPLTGLTLVSLNGNLTLSSHNPGKPISFTIVGS